MNVSDTKRKGSDTTVVGSADDILPKEPGNRYSPIEGNAPLPLADRAFEATPSTLGDTVLRFLKIRPPKAYDDLDAIATQKSVFDSDHADIYKSFIRDDWENLSAFDPTFRWTWREEKRTRRAIDLKIMLWVCVMFLALDIDRGNITNATADNFLKDLKLTQGDYNLGQTLAKVGFLTAELPSQLVSKRLGPDRWIPLQICIFSLIAAAQFWLSGRSSFFATRFLIAFFQGGFIPDVILYLSYFYPSRRLPIRLACFWMVNSTADLLTGFLGVGLLQMRGIGGHAGWRWMFLLEGIFTFLIGVASFFMMPTAPTKTKTWFRPNGYFTDRQVKVIVNSVIRDDPAKGGMHNRQPLTFKMILNCIGDYDMYPLYFIGLMFGIPGVPIKNYLQLSFKSLGFSTINSNLLSIPNTVITIVNLFIITAVSELVNNRSFVAMAENIWMLPNYIALLTLPDPINPWSYFAIATVLLGFPYVHALQVAWCSTNSGSVQNRTVSASLYNMLVQASGIIGSNIYQGSDAPRYYTGNKALVGIIVFNCVFMYPGTYFYYKWRNASRARKWDAMTEDQKAEYLATTKDIGNKRLDFRFVM